MDAEVNRLVVALVLFGAVCDAQEFEVASLARTMPLSMQNMGDRPGLAILVEPTILRMRAIPLAEAIKWAYDLKSYELVGKDGKTWSENPGMPNLYYIEGHFDPGAGRDQVKAMLRNLLKDRMGLRSHVEESEIAVNRLRKSSGGLSKIVTRAQEPLPETMEGSVLKLSSAGDPRQLQIDVQNGTIGQIANEVSRMIRAPLVDSTGLGDERYDVKHWVIDLSTVETFTAMQDSILGSLGQLGLSVSTGKSLVRVRVVDHINETVAN